MTEKWWNYVTSEIGNEKECGGAEAQSRWNTKSTEWKISISIDFCVGTKKKKQSEWPWMVSNRCMQKRDDRMKKIAWIDIAHPLKWSKKICKCHAFNQWGYVCLCLCRRVCVHVIGFCWKFCNHFCGTFDKPRAQYAYKAFLWKCNIDRLQYSGVLYTWYVYPCLRCLYLWISFRERKSGIHPLKHSPYGVYTWLFHRFYNRSSSSMSLAQLLPHLQVSAWHSANVPFTDGASYGSYVIQCSIRKPQNKLIYCLVFCFR